MELLTAQRILISQIETPFDTVQLSELEFGTGHFLVRIISQNCLQTGKA